MWLEYIPKGNLIKVTMLSLLPQAVIIQKELTQNGIKPGKQQNDNLFFSW